MMCDNTNEIHNKDKPTLGMINSLWSEYSYRHEHVWSNTFKLFAAALALSVVPYIYLKISDELKWFLIWPPILSLILLQASWQRLERELEILKKIRDTYREWQPSIHFVEVGEGSFTDHVKRFYGVISGAALINIGVSAAWLWSLPCGCTQ